MIGILGRRFRGLAIAYNQVTVALPAADSFDAADVFSATGAPGYVVADDPFIPRSGLYRVSMSARLIMPDLAAGADPGADTKWSALLSWLWTGPDPVGAVAQRNGLVAAANTDISALAAQAVMHLDAGPLDHPAYLISGNPAPGAGVRASLVDVLVSAEYLGPG